MAEPGLLRRIYNPRERVNARSEGPNPSGPATMVACGNEEAEENEESDC